MPFDSAPDIAQARDKKIVNVLRRLGETGAVLCIAAKRYRRLPTVLRHVQGEWRAICPVDAPVVALLVRRGLADICHEGQKVTAFRISATGEAHLKEALEKRARYRRALRRESE